MDHALAPLFTADQINLTVLKLYLYYNQHNEEKSIRLTDGCQTELGVYGVEGVAWQACAMLVEVAQAYGTIHKAIEEDINKRVHTNHA